VVLVSGRSIRCGRQIAEGGFSYVHIAFDSSGKPFALKRIRTQSSEQRKEAEHELEINRSLTKVQHRNILPLIDFGLGSPDEIVLLYPLMRQGSLRDVINRRVVDGRDSHWTPKALLLFFAGICRGLKVLHDKGLAHRDVKVENVLMTENGEPQLMDFGSTTDAVVKIANRVEALKLQDRASQHSTMSYRAPELFDVPSTTDVDSRTDVWSLGCVLFAMCYGFSPFECEFTIRPPYQCRVVECGYLRIIGRIPEPPEALRRHPPLVDTLVARLLQQHPPARPFIDGVLDLVAEARHFLENPSTSINVDLPRSESGDGGGSIGNDSGFANFDPGFGQSTDEFGPLMGKGDSI